MSPPIECIVSSEHSIPSPPGEYHRYCSCARFAIKGMVKATKRLIMFMFYCFLDCRTFFHHQQPPYLTSPPPPPPRTALPPYVWPFLSGPGSGPGVLGAAATLASCYHPLSPSYPPAGWPTPLGLSPHSILPGPRGIPGCGYSAAAAAVAAAAWCQDFQGLAEGMRMNAAAAFASDALNISSNRTTMTTTMTMTDDCGLAGNTLI